LSTATAVRSPAISPAHLRLGLGLALAAGIAWAQPFDEAFAAATFGSAPLRAAAIVLLALAGASLGRRVGLSAETAAPGRWRDALGAAIAVAVLCAVSDRAWRSALHPSYVDYIRATPLAVRTLLFAARALNENIIYRLFLSSLFVCILGAVWKRADGRPAPGAFWTAFVLAQGVNIWINVSRHAPLTPASALHDLVRYVAPGVVWGWLYWRRGFAANELASTSVHLFLQPLLTLLL
jgi:hypothetical protein